MVPTSESTCKFIRIYVNIPEKFFYITRMKEHVEKKENSDTVIHGDIKNNESGDKPGNVVSLENTTGN